MRSTTLLALLLAACGSEPSPSASAPSEPAPAAAPVPAPSAATVLPDVAVITAPTHEAKVPHPVASTPELAAARERLDAVVRAEAVVGDHPWALGHALLAFGPDLALPDGRSAVDATFADYGEEVDVAGKTLVRFPTSRGAVRIQPHAELLLKAFTEIGVPANREVQVAGTTHPVSDLYLHALSRSWTHGDRTGFDSYNDAPWALQAIATWAPGELAWTADGHEMTLDKYTSDVVAKLAADTKFMHDAFAAGAPLQKRKQGIFGYTCGGAHMLQGAMFAVGKGYGSDADKDKISAELAVLFPRLPFEVELVDGLLKQHPEYQVVLIEQRLKFLGHWVETLYKAEAMGLIEPSEAQRAQMELAVDQLVKTVIAIDKLGIYGKLDTVKASNEQTYLDYVGDSAHALRALDLATGQGVVRY